MAEVLIKLHLEPLEEGGYVATSDDVPGLVVEGRTIAETVEFAQDAVRKLYESYLEHGDPVPPKLKEAAAGEFELLVPVIGRKPARTSSYKKFESSDTYKIIRDIFKLVQGLLVVLLMVGAFLIQYNLAKLQETLKEPIIEVRFIKTRADEVYLRIEALEWGSGRAAFIETCEIRLIPWIRNQDTSYVIPAEKKKITLYRKIYGKVLINLTADLKNRGIDIGDLNRFEYEINVIALSSPENRIYGGILPVEYEEDEKNESANEN